MRILVVAFLLSLMSFLPAAAAKRIALIIGNDDYDHVVDLKNPGNDADLMERTLKSVGFEVMRFDDLDQREMKQAMLGFGRKLKDGAEVSMFYYAGHGVEIGGVNYLVPRDADLQNSEEADIQNVSVNSFLALTENTSVPLNIVILDACRNNPFRSLRTSGAGGLAPVKAPRGTYVAYSTSPGAVAADGDSKNSPFTQALSESIQQPGLSLEAVLKLTRTKVQAATNGAQLPFDSSAITGEFFFVPTAAQAREPTPSAAPLPSTDQQKIFQLDTAQEAYQAAGDDPALLQVVIRKFPGSVWAELATERIKKSLKVVQPEQNSSTSELALDHSILEKKAVSLYQSYLEVWSRPNSVALSDLAEFYSAEVVFYGKSVSLGHLMAEKRKFAERWPDRIYSSRDDSVEVRCDEISCRVSAIIDWDVKNRNKAKTSRGSAVLTLDISLASEKIHSENGAVLQKSNR